MTLFRPDANAAPVPRLGRPGWRWPQLPDELFLGSIDELVTIDRDWIPTDPDGSLYLRPFMFATEVFLGVRPAIEYLYVVIASPVGSYFKGGVKPVTVWVSPDYTRAAPGRHRRGQVRRQLRGQPGRRPPRRSSTAATRWSSSTPWSASTSTSWAA